MTGMQYENFVRRVFNCSRDHRHGADADIYRKLEWADTDLAAVDTKLTGGMKEYTNYIDAFSIVKKFVRNSIREGLQKIRFKASTEEMASLQEMLVTLERINFADKKVLDVYIANANSIFCRHGLVMQ